MYGPVCFPLPFTDSDILRGLVTFQLSVSVVQMEVHSSFTKACPALTGILSLALLMCICAYTYITIYKHSCVMHNYIFPGYPSLK